MAKILKAAGIIVGAVLVLAIVYLMVADLGFLKPRVEAIVSEATGREFRIDGDLSVKVLPSPRVVVEDATLSNPSWATEPEMVRVGHFSTSVGLWSLLSGPVVVHELNVSDVTVDLEANAEGDASWQFDRPEPTETTETDEEAGSLEAPVDLRQADISNIQVTLRRPGTGDKTFSVQNFNVDTGEDDVRSFSAAALLDELPISVDGTYADQAIDLAGKAGDVEFRTTSSFSGNTVDVDLSMGTVDAIGNLIAIEDLPAEDLSVTGDVSLEGQSVLLSDVVITLGSMQVAIDGSVDGAAATADLSMTAEGSDLQLLRAELPQIPFAATTEAKLSGESVTLSPLELEFGESAVSASVDVRLGDTPAVNVTARSPLVDLSPFLADEEDAAENDADAAAQAEEGDERYVFKDEPLPLDALDKATANIDVTIDRLQMPAAAYTDFVVMMSLQDGKLVLENGFNGEAGGTFKNDVSVTAGSDGVDLDADIKADGLKLVALAGPDISKADIPASAAEMAIRATGDTPRALAESVNGKVLFMQGPGRVDNNIIGKVSGDILSQLFGALNPLAEKEQFSNWECSVFGIDFESGLGTIDPFLAQGEKIMIVGGGKIDLNTEKLDIEFNTKPREGVGISADMFVTPFVALSGTLASPSVGLNEKGLLLSGGAAVLTGGMSFLYQGLADRATAQVDQCEKAFESIDRDIPGRGD